MKELVYRGEVRRPTDVIADAYSPTSLSGRARSRRWQLFSHCFPDIAELRVVDLGGDARHWEGAPVRPRELVLVNLYAQEPPADWMEVVVADACGVPDELRGERFDLAYSNSTIEHVGGHWRRLAFADAVHALADRHWIQTPNRYFPLEPHWLFPGLQFLPLEARSTLTRKWPLGHEQGLWKQGRANGELHTAEARNEAVGRAMNVELLTSTAMRHYFPRSEILRERFLGLTKSLIAMRREGEGAG